MHGRKGPKSDPTICGTTVKYLADNSTFPVIIIKDPRTRQIKKEGRYRFGVCFDTSTKSLSALRLTLSLMRPDDNLTCITVKEPNVRVETVEGTVN